MKFGLSIFSTLVIIIGAVLFLQYQVHSSASEGVEKEFRYSQEIEVVYRAESLDIRHHFKNLPEQHVRIQIPQSALGIECFLETENSCERLDVENHQFLEGQKRTQSISYVIPVTGGLTESVLLKDVFANLTNGEVQYSIVHISTDSSTLGQWVTGLPLIGEQQLTLVNYAMFSGEGEVRDLYWNAHDIAVQSVHPSITLYSEEPISLELKEALGELQLLDDAHLSIVHSYIEGSSNRILFMPELSMATVQERLLMSQLRSYYQFDEGLSNDVNQILLYYLTGIQATSNKANAMIEKLQSLMSETQQMKWEQLLFNQEGQELTPKVLDDLLSQVLGSMTNYFEQNNKVDTVYPFYYVDGREIYYNNKPQEMVEVIFYEGRVLYSAQPLLEALGYNAYEGENGYYVNNETRIFRFPENHGFYVFNQRRYNVTSAPIVKIEQEYFIEESWMQRLFLVELNKNDTTINITSMNAQIE